MTSWPLKFRTRSVQRPVLYVSALGADTLWRPRISASNSSEHGVRLMCFISVKSVQKPPQPDIGPRKVKTGKYNPFNRLGCAAT
jgi:hypothetical protein